MLHTPSVSNSFHGHSMVPLPLRRSSFENISRIAVLRKLKLSASLQSAPLRVWFAYLMVAINT